MELDGEYLTISEMAERLEITYLTAKQRLLRAGIKPVTKEVLYDKSALEAIRNVPGRGRPPKAPFKEPEKEKPEATVKPALGSETMQARDLTMAELADRLARIEAELFSRESAESVDESKVG
jgi:hypothetical protein